MKKFFIGFISFFLVIFIAFSFFGKDLYTKYLFKDTSFDTSQRSEIIDIKLKKDDYVLFGSYNGEKILWQVADIKDGRPLLVSKYIICFKAYSVGDDRWKYGTPDFDKSTLKIWLNSADENVKYSKLVPDENSVLDGYNAYDKEKGFLADGNFTAEERNLISPDGVFIMSKKDMQNCLTKKQRSKACTKGAAEQNNSPYIVSDGKALWYWTSSSISQNRMSLAVVTADGGFYKSLPYDSMAGVVPSMYLNKSDFSSLEGTGRQKDPYLIVK